MRRVYVLIAAVLLVAIVSTYYVKENASPSKPGNTPNESTAASLPSREIPEGYAEFRDTFYRFSVLYPAEIHVQTYKEPVTKLTVVFEHPDGRAFQIHVLPYGDPQITDTRLRLDIPSGVFEEPTDVMIDSVRATMFKSQDASLGATREVWFINNGFLYEVTASLEHDAWLSEIMRTWLFVQ